MADIRVATARDFDACIDIFSGDERPWLISSLKTLLGSWLIKNSVYVAPDPDDEILGFLACDYEAFTEAAYLRLVYVREDARGAGHATALVQHAIDQAENRGLRRVFADAPAHRAGKDDLFPHLASKFGGEYAGTLKHMHAEDVAWHVYSVTLGR